MSSQFREKGSYYDVPADVMDLSVNLGAVQPAYDPQRYMKKQREAASQSNSKVKEQEYKYNRYA